MKGAALPFLFVQENILYYSAAFKGEQLNPTVGISTGVKRRGGKMQGALGPPYPMMDCCFLCATSCVTVMGKLQ